VLRLSINKILLSLSGLQLVIIAGIGYGIYRAGRIAEREYQGIRTDANALLTDAPEVIRQFREIQPTLNTVVSDVQTLRPRVDKVDKDLTSALELLRNIERRLPP